MNAPMDAVLLVFMALNLIGIVLLWLRIDRSSSDLRHLDTRVTKLEVRLVGLPTHHELTKIRDCISVISADVSGMNERTGVTAGMVATIQRHMLQEEKR